MNERLVPSHLTHRRLPRGSSLLPSCVTLGHLRFPRCPSGGYGEGVGSGGQGVSDTQSERYGWRNEVTASRTRRSLTHYVAEGVASEARRQARDESNEMRDRRLAREPGHK